MSRPQIRTFWEEVSKNWNNIFCLMTTFYNFTFKTETSFAKKVVKPILETWNVNGVIVYISFIYFRIKKIENMQCKKQF